MFSALLYFVLVSSVIFNLLCVWTSSFNSLIHNASNHGLELVHGKVLPNAVSGIRKYEDFNYSPIDT